MPPVHCERFGRLILTDADSSAAVKTLRMPLAPKPVSAMRVAGSDIAFDSNGLGALEQTLTLQGTAVDQGGYAPCWCL